MSHKLDVAATTLAYDVENHLTSVVKGGVTTSFAYNGDGARVKRSVSNTGTTYYIGNYFEVWVPNSGTTTFNKYYYFGSQRVAAKIAGTLFYFQGDHLGSSSVAMTQAGTSFYSRQTYFPFGAQRTTEGSALPTDNTFTGQKSDDSTGLLFYNARYYDTTLGRFIQPDTIVPNPLNLQSLNRFAYVLNNPLKYTDPTGHVECWDEDCNGGPSGGGGGGGSGGGGGGDSGNVNPCNADPTAEGCPGAQEAVPAETGQNQGPEDEDNCNIGLCRGEDASEKLYVKGLEVASCNCTKSIGFSGAAAVIFGVDIDLAIVIWDDQGNVQWGAFTANFIGSAGVGGSVVLYGQQATGTVKDQEGWGTFTGISGGEVIVAGYDRVYGKDRSYEGDRAAIGVGGGLFPVEVHTGAGYTWFLHPPW